MKKNVGLVIVALLALLAIPANAQLKFGVKGGVNISSVHFSSDVLNADNVTGFQVGPMIETSLPLVGVGLDAAVMYSQRGMKTKTGVSTTSMRTDFIDIPVNLKWKLGLPIVKPYLAVGPYVGFRVGGDKVWDVPGSVIGQLEAKNFSAGLNFGAGVELVSHLQVGFNYGLGLTDNFSASKVDLKAKNRGWSITAAILF